jgi:hypothetical protein
VLRLSEMNCGGPVHSWTPTRPVKRRMVFLSKCCIQSNAASRQYLFFLKNVSLFVWLVLVCSERKYCCQSNEQGKSSILPNLFHWGVSWNVVLRWKFRLFEQYLIHGSILAWESHFRTISHRWILVVLRRVGCQLLVSEKKKPSLGFAISMLITIHECSTMHSPTILDSISKTKQSKSKYFNTNVHVISHDIVPQKLLNSQTNCKKNSRHHVPRQRYD